MTDHPIIFSAAMIQALLAGRKTMTRRLLYTERKAKGGIVPARTTYIIGHPPPMASRPEYYCALSGWERVKPGDRLWVRESLCKRQGNFLGIKQSVFEPHYAADDAEVLNEHEFNYVWIWKGKSLPSIYMPRWASRLTLVVTATKIERLQDISAIDAACEGLRIGEIVVEGRTKVVWFGANDNACSEHPIDAFECLWVQLHGPEFWRQNPEVVCLSFQVHKQNIDAMKEAA